MNKKSALILGFLAAELYPAAYAQYIATVTGSTTLLSDTNRSVTDNSADRNPVTTSQSGTLPILQFNPSTGVLIQVDAKLTPTGTDGPPYLRAGNSGNSRGSASVSATWSGGGLSALGTLNSVTKDTNLVATDNSWNPLTQTLTNPVLLDSWVGSGDVSTTLSTTLAANRTNSSGSNLIASISSTSSANTLTNLTADYEVKYSYYLHANPSFDSTTDVLNLTLDFGTVNQGDIPVLSFSIFNLAGTDRVALDLDSFTGIGDVTKLTTDLTTFTGLTQGGGRFFQAFFDTSSLGSFSASYTLSLSDADVGAPSSRHTYTMTLNLRGNVIPEPASLALLGLGLLGLGGWSRRQKI